jgi:hypothetical protein
MAAAAHPQPPSKEGTVMNRKLVVGTVANVTTIGWIRDRLDLDPAAGRGIDDEIRYLRAVAEAREFPAAATHAVRLRSQVRAAALAQ